MICQGSSDFLCSIQFPWPQEHLGWRGWSSHRRLTAPRGRSDLLTSKVTLGEAISTLWDSTCWMWFLPITIIIISFNKKRQKKTMRLEIAWIIWHLHMPQFLHPICDLPIKSWMSKWWIWRISFGLPPPPPRMPVPNEGLYGSSGIPFIKNIMILVVTLTGQGDNPRYQTWIISIFPHLPTNNDCIPLWSRVPWSSLSKNRVDPWGRDATQGIRENIEGSPYFGPDGQNAVKN